MARKNQAGAEEINTAALLGVFGSILADVVAAQLVTCQVLSCLVANIKFPRADAQTDLGAFAELLQGHLDTLRPVKEQGTQSPQG